MDIISEQMMASYDVGNWGKASDVYKNDLGGDRNITGNPNKSRGRLFIT